MGFDDGQSVFPNTSCGVAYHAETVSFPWQQGDLLMPRHDNMLVAHGRAPYTGRREVLVGMAEPITEEQVRI
jgi:hypothetical protein